MKVKKPTVIKKPWGREIWIVEEKEYAGKILEINKGHRTSLHYHKNKKESMYVLKGKLKVIMKDNSTRMVNIGESITINPGEAHSLEAVEDLMIIEVSTPELYDVIRIKDDYGRVK